MRPVGSLDALRREVIERPSTGTAPVSWRLDHEVTETVVAFDRPARPALAFIGAGRAGSALAQGLANAGYRISAIHSRTAAHASRLAESTGADVVATAAAAAHRAEITFLTVPDGEIVRVAATIAAAGIALPGRSLVHCSATHGPAVLAAAALTTASLGAFHPLQALAGSGSASLLAGSSFALQATPPLLTQLQRLVADLGGHLLDLPPAGRTLYHAAAVLAGNAPLALLARATSLLEEAGVSRPEAHRALAALLAGAAANAIAAGPASALTGPVVRGDAETVARHLDALSADPSTRELYRRLAYETLSLAGLEGREAVAAALDAAVSLPPAAAAVSVFPRRRVA